MRNPNWVFLSAVLVILQGVNWVSEAGAVTWSVKDSGGTIICSGSGNPFANLPTTCGASLEFQGSGDTARITSNDTGVNDILELLNTRIFAKQDLTDYVLTFEHTFAPGPTSANYTPIYYRTQMYGTISSVVAPNKITVTSTVQHPVGTELLNAGPLVHPPPQQLPFNKSQSPSTSTAMNLDRKIIVNVKFSLNTNRYVEFPNNRFVRVIAQPYPDDPAGEDGNVGGPLGRTLDSLESGSKACVGLSLPDGGCAGISVTK